MTSKERLEQYIKEDTIYNEYLDKHASYVSDFDKFCIEHCKDIKNILYQNEELNKKYINAVSDYEQEKFNVEELKKQLEHYKKLYKKELKEETELSEMWCDSRAKIRELETQQKEFVKYLENWYKITKEQHDELNEPVRKNFLQVQMDTITEILAKYKEIIGDVEDE